MAKYKVRLYIDSTYEVYEEIAINDGWDIIEDSCFTGSLSDCESWIRLKESGRF